MVRSLLHRTLQSVVVLFLVSIGAFYIMHAAPGTPFPVLLPDAATRAALQAQMHALWLDRPIWMQYFHWLWTILHGNLGYTSHDGTAVASAVWGGFQATLRLIVPAWLCALLIAIPLAAYNSQRPYSLADNTTSALTYICFAFPTFWVGMMLQFLFGLHWLVLPMSSLYDSGHEGEFGNMALHMLLPWVTMMISLIVTYYKFMRNSMMEQLPSEYVRVSRSKGVTEFRVIYRHVMRNALIPMITVLSFEFPTIISSAALIENVFKLPGLGSLVVNSAFSRDYGLMMGAILFLAAIVTVFNWVADMLYAVVDPRIRLTK